MGLQYDFVKREKVPGLSELVSQNTERKKKLDMEVGSGFASMGNWV
jgi:hypothetical protein